MTTKRYCDFCDTEIKGEQFWLQLDRDGNSVKQGDLCAGCKNKVSGFLESLGAEEN